jgi:hypothetical protein
MSWRNPWKPDPPTMTPERRQQARERFFARQQAAMMRAQFYERQAWNREKRRSLITCPEGNDPVSWSARHRYLLIHYFGWPPGAVR